MIKRIFIVSLILIQASNAFAKSNLTTAGDMTQIALPLTGFGVAVYKKDKEGQKQFLKDFLTNIALTHALKFAFRHTDWNERPNGGNYSFPSGHTAIAFQGALFLQTRYGASYGAVPIALAGFTGYTRVRGNYHHWRDVIGGAVLAYGVNQFFVTKYESTKVNVNVGKDVAMLDFKMNF
jgi:hypothetical protein